MLSRRMYTRQMLDDGREFEFDSATRSRGKARASLLMERTANAALHQVEAALHESPGLMKACLMGLST